jgi:hypothetical protein
MHGWFSSGHHGSAFAFLSGYQYPAHLARVSSGEVSGCGVEACLLVKPRRMETGCCLAAARILTVHHHDVFPMCSANHRTQSSCSGSHGSQVVVLPNPLAGWPARRRRGWPLSQHVPVGQPAVQPSTRSPRLARWKLCSWLGGCVGSAGGRSLPLMTSAFHVGASSSPGEANRSGHPGCTMPTASRLCI